MSVQKVKNFPIVTISHIHPKTMFIFLKKLSEKSLEVLYYQISTSVKRLGMQLPSKVNFSTFLQLNCSNLKLKLCERS